MGRKAFLFHNKCDVAIFFPNQQGTNMFRQNVHMINFPHGSKGAKRVTVTHLVEQVIFADLLYKEGIRIIGGREVYLENHIRETELSKNLKHLKKINTRETSSLLESLSTLFWEVIEPDSINSITFKVLSH